jgi:energy-coupling factor transport system permease protein
LKELFRLTPKQKLILIALSSFFAVTTDNPFLLAGYLIALILLLLSRHFSRKQIEIWIAVLLLTWWGTIFSQSLFYYKEPRTVLLVLLSPNVPFIGKITGGISVYQEGMKHGMIQAMRLCISITCGLFVCFSTESKDILRAAVRLKLPYTLSFMVSIGLRFIPLIVEETKTVLGAQRMRGFSPLRSGILHPLKTARIIVTPILINCIRRSSMLSLSVESRHFGRKQALYQPAKDCIGTRPAALILSLLGCGIAIMAGIKLFYFLYTANFYYAPSLRPLYELAEKYL